METKQASVAVIEGTRGGGDVLATALQAAGAAVLRLHWRCQLQAILPGFRGGNVRALDTSRGDLRGVWALVSLATTSCLAEAMLIEDEVRGLGMRVAFLTEHGRSSSGADLAAIATADLLVFASREERDAAHELATRSGATGEPVRDQFRVARTASDILALLDVGHPGGSVHELEVVAPRRVYYWTGLTVTQPFTTGVQRVTRALGCALQGLGVELIPVKRDPKTSCVVSLNEAEAARLAEQDGPATRPALAMPIGCAGEWLLIPETAVPVVSAKAHPVRLAHDRGMRVAAVFIDLIPLKMPEYYDGDTIETHFNYWDGLSEADLLLPISWTTAGDLSRYLAGRGLRMPPIVPCPLAGQFARTPRARGHADRGTPAEPLRLLAIGTLEPRKNYCRLLRALIAARRLAPHSPIHLTIVGRRAGYAALESEIERLVADAGGVELMCGVSDTELLNLFASSHAMVFASWEEGFGLPVLEGLWRGLPCICHAGSAMLETAAGGGALAVNMLDEAAIARAIAGIAREPSLLRSLTTVAEARTIKTWSEYAAEVLKAMTRTIPVPSEPPYHRAVSRRVALAGLPTFVLAVHDSAADHYISADIIRAGSWEPFETEVIRRLLAHYRLFVDVGANIGWYTVIAGLILREQGAVHAFEPSVINCRLLERNIRANGLDNVTLHQVAVGSYVGTTELYLAADNQGDHSLHGSGEHRAGVTVPVTTLDTCFAQTPPTPFLFKADTQGAEAAILAGARRLLHADGGRSAFVMEFWPFGLEAYGWPVASFLDALEHLGREVFVLDEAAGCLWRSSADALAEAASGDLRPQNRAFRNVVLLPYGLASSPEIQPLIR